MADQKVRITISLPDSLVDLLEIQAGKRGRDLETEIWDRLQRCQSYTAGRPLYFNDKQRAELEKLTGGHLIDNPDVAIARVRSMVKIAIKDVNVELDDRVLQRVYSRAQAERKTMEEVIKRETINGMEVYAGLRPA